MQLEPRNNSFCTPAWRAPSMTFADIIKLSYRKSYGAEELW